MLTSPYFAEFPLCLCTECRVMGPQWFCKIGEKEFGPFSAQQLAGLVRTKRISPSDYIRKDDSKWVLASRVKGLFPSESGSGQATTVTRHEVTTDWVPGQSDEPGSATGGSVSSGGSVPAGSVSGGSVPGGSAPGGSAPGGSQQGASTPSQGASAGGGEAAKNVAAMLIPGATMGNYKILETLGEGGMGVVLKAQHVRMERMVALKVLRGQATESPAAIKRFHQEVRAAARLSHPNIVTAFDADDVQGVHFLVMEYVNGQNLADYLSERGKLDIAEAVNYVKQTAQGLAYAHGEGVVHRDIKPGNLLLDKKGVVKILDMGLASIREPRESDEVHADVTQANQLLGTFDYMPPEQAEDPRSVDHRADIYSLGCSLYRLITGHLPFKGDSPIKKIIAHRDHPIPSLRDGRPDAPHELDRIFRKMLAKKPEERFQSMAEVIEALEHCFEERPAVDLGASGGGYKFSGASAKFSDGDDEYKLSTGETTLRAGGESIVVPVSGSDDDDDFGGFNLAPVDGAEERWYWQCMGQEAGPFTLRQLRGKKLGPEDLVRRENGRKWFRAAEIAGLF
jgi:serine/threonine protein kinase